MAASSSSAVATAAPAFDTSVAKVVLSKPGQRFPTPSPGAGDRVFYESLYRCLLYTSDAADE